MTFLDYIVNNIEHLYEDFEMSVVKKQARRITIRFFASRRFVDTLSRRLKELSSGKHLIISGIKKPQDMDQITLWIEKYYPEKFKMQANKIKKRLKIVTADDDQYLMQKLYNIRKPKTSNPMKNLKIVPYKPLEKKYDKVCDMCGKSFKGSKVTKRCSKYCQKLAQKIRQGKPKR